MLNRSLPNSTLPYLVNLLPNWASLPAEKPLPEANITLLSVPKPKGRHHWKKESQCLHVNVWPDPIVDDFPASVMTRCYYILHMHIKGFLRSLKWGLGGGTGTISGDHHVASVFFIFLLQSLSISMSKQFSQIKS